MKCTVKNYSHVLLAALTLVGGLSLAPESASAYYSLLGGQTLKVRDSAIEVQVGYPEVRIGYHIPILKNLEITPRLNLFYNGFGNFASASEPFIGNFGTRLGVDIKYRFYNKNRIHLAVVAPIGLHLNFTDGFAGAIQMGIPGGIEMTWEATKSLNLVAGFKMPFSVYFSGGLGGTFAVPFIFDVGTEFAINDQLNMSVLLEVGPVVGTNSGFTFTSTWIAGFVGMQYRL